MVAVVWISDENGRDDGWRIADGSAYSDADEPGCFIIVTLDPIGTWNLPGTSTWLPPQRSVRPLARSLDCLLAHGTYARNEK